MMKSFDRRDDKRRDSLTKKSVPMKKLVPLPTNNPRRVKNKLYICGLLPTVMREEVIKTFAGYGKLQEVWVAKKPAGFAFVEFINARDAERVVHELDGKKLFGSAIRIEFAKSNKFPDDSKFQKKPLNLPLLPLQPSLLPMKIPLLGPPMPLATPSNHLLTSPPSRPLLDSKPREFHHPHPNRQFSHHSPFKRRRSISPDRQFSGRYSRSPPRRRMMSPRRSFLLSPRAHHDRSFFPPHRRSPSYKSWGYPGHHHPSENFHRGFHRGRGRARGYMRHQYRSPIRFPRYAISPDRNKGFRGSMSPIRSRRMDSASPIRSRRMVDDGDSSDSEEDGSVRVKSQVKSVTKLVEARKTPVEKFGRSVDRRDVSRSLEKRGGSRSFEKRGGSRTYEFGIELKKRIQSSEPRKESSGRMSLSESPRRKQLRMESEDRSPPLSLSRTQLLGRTPPSPPSKSPLKTSMARQSFEKDHSSVSMSASPERRVMSRNNQGPMQRSLTPKRPMQRSLTPKRPMQRSFSPKRPMQRPIQRSHTPKRLAPPPIRRQQPVPRLIQHQQRRRSRDESSDSSSSESSSESQSEEECRKMVMKKKKKSESSSSSRSSSKEAAKPMMRRRPSRQSSSDSRKTPLAYQKRRSSLSPRKPSPFTRNRSPPNKMHPPRAFRSKEFSPGKHSPPYPPQFARNHPRHSPPVHHRASFSPGERRVFERSPEPRRFYEGYSNNYYPERMPVREPFYYKRGFYQDYPGEGHFYRRPAPYFQGPPHYPPYRRREPFPGPAPFYPHPRNKTPFVYRGKIRNPPIIYNRSEAKKE